MLAVAIGLAGCSVTDTLFDGFKHVSDVRNDLAAATGMKPEVGFNWHNGRLNKVTVTFPHLYRDKALTELAETVRQAVSRIQASARRYRAARLAGPGARGIELAIASASACDTARTL